MKKLLMIAAAGILAAGCHNYKADVETLNKDKELADLNTKRNALNAQVATLNTNVTTLTSQNEEKTKIIDDQTVTMHTAYYTKGTYKELEGKNVLTKEGGFLGI